LDTGAFLEVKEKRKEKQKTRLLKNIFNRARFLRKSRINDILIYWLKVLSHTRYLLVKNYTAKVWILKALRHWGIKKDTTLQLYSTKTSNVGSLADPENPLLKTEHDSYHHYKD